MWHRNAIVGNLETGQSLSDGTVLTRSRNMNVQALSVEIFHEGFLCLQQVNVTMLEIFVIGTVYNGLID